jgi:hypothetical protein
MNDQELLARSIAALKRTGRIEYTGEFGPEITTFIPYVAWLKREGLLEGRQVVTHAGMEPYYFFLGDGELATKSTPRRWALEAERDWPTNSTYTATSQPWHVYPDFRGHYREMGRTFERPVLFIQNKFTVEYDMGPLNYLPLNALEWLLAAATRFFHVVYSRPRYIAPAAGFSLDHNTACDYPDLDVVRRAEGVEILEESCAQSGAPYNRTKLEVLAKSHIFVSVQGGGAHLLACFGHSLLLLLHMRGEEYPHAYRSGPYKYLASPPPVLLVARNDAELGRGLRVIHAATPVEGGIEIGDYARADFDALRI